MNFINKAIISFIPILPKGIVKIFSKKYVAGTNNATALGIVRKLNKDGQDARIDILGEHSKSTNESISIRNKYIELYKSIRLNKLDCHIWNNYSKFQSVPGPGW